MAESLKILVVEDESLIAEMLRMMLEEMGHEVPFVAYTEDSGRNVLENESIDFAIFDINLKHGTEGINLARIARDKEIPFMFLTSYSDKGTVEQAKETKPGAYVIKPFTEEEVYTGIEMSLMHARGDRQDVITIKDGHRNILLKTDEVLFLKAENIYVEIYAKEKRYLTRLSLTGFLKDLPKHVFIRVHRSYAVNRNHITALTRNTLEIGKHVIPISRSYRDEVYIRLKG